jgi:hypothetical protein
MVSKTLFSAKSIITLKFIQKADFKVKQWFQRFQKGLIPPPEHKIHRFSSTESKSYQRLENLALEKVLTQHLNVIPSNIPRLKRIESLCWLQFYTVSPPTTL